MPGRAIFRKIRRMKTGCSMCTARRRRSATQMRVVQARKRKTKTKKSAEKREICCLVSCG
jgi:hypothetical protein